MCEAIIGKSDEDPFTQKPPAAGSSTNPQYMLNAEANVILQK